MAAEETLWALRYISPIRLLTAMDQGYAHHRAPRRPREHCCTQKGHPSGHTSIHILLMWMLLPDTRSTLTIPFTSTRC